jgi:hypothetical protein
MSPGQGGQCWLSRALWAARSEDDDIVGISDLLTTSASSSSPMVLGSGKRVGSKGRESPSNRLGALLNHGQIVVSFAASCVTGLLVG